MSDRIKDLLHEVADGVQPGERLEAIRAATGTRRPARGWWAAGGVGLVAASVVTAVALTTGDAPRSSDPDPAGPSPTPTSTPPTTATDPVTRGDGLEAWVYYVGDTPNGQRLYRELRETNGDNPFAAAEDGLGLAPLDPDYVSLWPSDAIQGVSFDGIGDDGVISVSIDRTYALRPTSMTADQAVLAVEQVIRTFQAATRSRAAVWFHADGSPIAQVLGVPTSEPVAAGPDFDVLAPVSLSGPSEGQVVDNDQEYLYVRGRASSDGPLDISIERVDGTLSLGAGTLTGLLRPDRFKAFGPGFTLAGAEPGDYEVIATVRGADGTVHTDTRRITVVD